MIIPDPDHILVAVDLSQAEVRVVAWESGNEEFIYFFESGKDIHQVVADEIGIERKICKNMVHGANYLVGAKTFAESIGKTVAQSKVYIARYFSRFPAIPAWQRRVIAEVRATRTLTNIFGRERTFYGRIGPDFDREAVAQGPQSTVGDLLNIGMVKLFNKGYDILIQVHDEVLMQIPLQDTITFVDYSNKKEEPMSMVNYNILRDIKSTMQIPMEINGRELIIPAEISIGMNWKDMKEAKL